MAKTAAPETPASIRFARSSPNESRQPAVIFPPSAERDRVVRLLVAAADEARAGFGRVFGKVGIEKPKHVWIVKVAPKSKAVVTGSRQGVRRCTEQLGQRLTLR